MEIKKMLTAAPKEKPAADILGFGKYFTDHMFMMDYTEGEGWHDARIVPFGPIAIHPASTVLHYGSEIFEGLKAYRRGDGKVQLFRPIENIRRMNNSAERMCLPPIPEDMAMEALTEFVKTEQEWTPSAPGTSLYLRPFMFGNDESLGVHAVHNATYVIIASPVGSYYKEGINPVKIMIETEDVRAVRGGTGEAKCGGNYAASNRAGKRAEEKGYSQVLWLDGVHRKYIEEVGAMNVMFKINGEIVTPALSGSILPGITRKSIIEVLKGKGYAVSERLLSIDELKEAMANGSLEEAWGCGTAAVVSPIGELSYEGVQYPVNGGEIGPVTQMLYDTLTGIQWGKIDDPYGWTVQL
ncbi:MAG: branched-chain amino acid aminotransferase [Clostridia bacterium]|nr:branched-chain amino acid aminotransferase [Clostridia bacterium]